MSGLYEELGVGRDASKDEIRKAYRKRALETHPDRLPPDASPADRYSSNENFRRVNNAYEVLSDPKKRSEYDIHGVWPLPDDNTFSPFEMRNYERYNGSDPFDNHFFRRFEFKDPFTLFDDFFGKRSHHHSSAFNDAIRISNQMMNSVHWDGFPSSSNGAFPHPSIGTSQLNNSGSRWVSESYVSSTVNGVTQTIRKRIDSNGNEHVLRKYSDGHEIRTINGVEQPTTGYAPYSDPQRLENRYSQPNPYRSYGPPPAYSRPLDHVATPYSHSQGAMDNHFHPSLNDNHHEERHKRKKWYQ